MSVDPSPLSMIADTQVKLATTAKLSGEHIGRLLTFIEDLTARVVALEEAQAKREAKPRKTVSKTKKKRSR